jgi:hypothetical protein
MFPDPDRVTLPETSIPKSTWGTGPVARPMSIVGDASATPNADRLPLGVAFFWTVALSLLGWAVILTVVLEVR